MKRRFCVLMVLLSVLMLMSSAFSATWTDNASNNTFSFTGTTVSTSTQQSGHGTTYYRVTGSADISGTADALGDNTVYKAEMWLMVSGDINTSALPSKDNIDQKKIENSVFRDTHTLGAAKILYKSHPVGSLADSEFDPTQAQTQTSLSDSTSAYYVNGSYSSPTGLSASPEVYGSLSGTLMNHVGNKEVIPLTFKSDTNTATGENLDDGSRNIVAEKCQRKQNCKKPRTAKRATSHRVECPEEKWIWEGIKFWGHKFFSKKKACDGVWWTCDDAPDFCPLMASHVRENEKSWKQKYVSPSGGVSQYPPTDDTPNCPDCTSHCSSPCSCSTSGTCSGTVVDNTPSCSGCTSHCSSPCSCGSGTCNGTMVTAACGVHKIESGSSSAYSHRSISYPCSTHTYYACQTPSTSSHAYVSSCSETENGNTCNNSSGYYACAPHSHTYPAPSPPSTPEMITCAAGHSYSANHPNRSYLDNYHRTRECRFSGCSNSWQACINGWTAPLCNNAYRKSKGWKCGAK